MTRERVLHGCVVAAGLTLVACGGQAQPAGNCPQAVQHLFGLVDKAAGSAEGAERKLMQQIVRATTVQCQAEGLSPAQTQCVMAMRHIDEVATLDKCPAIAARRPSWIIGIGAPPTTPIRRNSNGTPQLLLPPADVAGQIHVFDYQAFGPQALAQPLVGPACYGDCCCAEPGDSFDVKVVVYHGVALDAVKPRFVVDGVPDAYRFVAAPAALEFLINAAAQPQTAEVPGLAATLAATQAVLQRRFPTVQCAAPPNAVCK